MDIEISLLLPRKARSRKVLSGCAAPDSNICVLAVFLAQPAVRLYNGVLQLFGKLGVNYGSPYPSSPFPQVGYCTGIQPLKGFLHQMHYPAFFKELPVRIGSNSKSIRDLDPLAG